MFTPDGKLGDIARGRDSIKKFLLSFVNVKFLSQHSTKFIELKGDSATQTGTFLQCYVVNEKDTSCVKGSFKIKWRWLKGEGWKIKEMGGKLM